MHKGKILAFIGMALIGTSVFVMLSYAQTQAQSSSIAPLTLSSITSVSSSNPGGNYSWSGAGELWNDNNGISLWTGSFPTPNTECGHLGMAAGLQRTTDVQRANVWENRNTCNGNIAVGIADRVEAQVLTVNGTTVDGKNVTIDINVPAVTGNSLGNWKLYVDDTGGTYYCRADHSSAPNRYPNDCDLTIAQALTAAHLARSGNSPVCGNNLCQSGETYSSCSSDCPAPPPTCTLNLVGGVTSYPSDSTTFVNYTYTCSAPTSVAVQVVKPDGTATTYNSATNITTSAMGFGTSNLTAGNYTLRICVNDTTCSPSSFVSVPFTITAATPAAPAITAVYSTENLGQREVVLTVTDNSNNETEHRAYWHLSGTNWPTTFDATGTYTWSLPANLGRAQLHAPTAGGTYEYRLDACNAAGCTASNTVFVVVPGTAGTTVNPPANTSGNCTRLNLNLDKTSYARGENVNYNYSCSTPAIGALIQTAIVQLLKPDGTAVTYVTGSNISTPTMSMGFDTANLSAGAYTLRVCMETACPAASTTSVNFTVTGSGTGTDSTVTTPTTDIPPTNTTNTHPAAADATTTATGMRECVADELPFNCRMPMYRWNLKDKTWEKCNYDNIPSYVDVKGNSTVRYTNCEAMNSSLEREWKTERNKVHPPEVDGEWYMPPWDAASSQLQYNPKTDQFGECVATAATTYAAGSTPEYIAPCTPIPDIDRGWMLKKFRAEYKMYQSWNSQQKAMPTVPGVPVATQVLDTMINPVQTVEIPTTQCKPYLAGIKQGLAGDKQFWKDINVQFKQVGDKYEDAGAVNELLQKSKNLILELDKLIKSGACAQENIQSIQAKLDELHTGLYPQLVAYTPALNDYLQYKQCRQSLEAIQAQFEKMLGKKIDEKSKTQVADHVKSIKDKLQELDAASADDFEYDKVYECNDFKNTFQADTATFVRSGDKELNRIIDDVVAAKMKENVAELKAELEDRGQKIDLLLLQVAELHQSIESMSQQATFISEQIAVSYSALTRINSKFEEQKAQMQTAKGVIIPLVEQATQAIQETKCVNAEGREALIKEFGQIAAINWLGDKASEIEKRLNLFVTSCQAKEVVPADVTALTVAVTAADAQNLANSYEQGLTPFADVPTHEWYYGAMVTANEVGAMTQGRPAENVLRQDALLMVLRAAGATDAELVGECDLAGVPVVAVSPYAACAVKLAYEKGLNLRGRMQAPVSRVEIAQWLEKIMSLTTTADDSILDEYLDLKGLDATEKGAVKAIIANEIMVGNISGETAYFTPRDPLTRAALAVVLEKILSLKGTLPK